VASHDPALDRHFGHRLTLVDGRLQEAGRIGVQPRGPDATPAMA